MTSEQGTPVLRAANNTRIQQYFFSSLKSRILSILTSRVNLTELCSKRSLARLQKQYFILSLGRRWRDLTLRNLTGKDTSPVFHHYSFISYFREELNKMMVAKGIPLKAKHDEV